MPDVAAPVALTADVETSQKRAASNSDAAAAECEKELARLYRAWYEEMNRLQNLAQSVVARFPNSRPARFFLADVLQAGGRADMALDEFERLREQASPNELHRISQGIEQSRSDRDYFPDRFAKRLATGEYAAGHNAKVWRDYARRDIQRGREIVRLLRQVKPLAGKRVLDVGCGYGGMLISMAEQGADAVGVEIDPERANMGRLRLQELGVQVKVFEADIAAPGMAEGLGTFDVITCQDVLEHVMDPTLMIRTVSSLLRPGGLIYVQVPNKWGIQQLLADHHYALTGITALSRNQAIEYWQLATGEKALHYGVGYPRGERYYLKAFARSGVTIRHVQNFGSLDHLAWFARDVAAMCTRLQSQIYPGLRPVLQARIQRRILKVLDLYANSSKLIMKWQSQPERMPERVNDACDRIVRRLCLPLWQFIGVKSAAKSDE